MSWRPVAVESLYDEVALALSRRQSPFERTTILVPDHSSRERLLRYLIRSYPQGVAGVEVVTLHTFVERIAPDQPHPSKEILQIRFRKYLHSLPEHHPFAPLQRHVSGTRALLAAAEELIEANVDTTPNAIKNEQRPFVEALLALKEFAQKAKVGHRAIQFRKAAETLQKNTASHSSNVILPKKIIFVGFYDFAPSQGVFFIELTRAYRQRDGNTEAIAFLLPTAVSEYAEYSHRLKPLLQKTLGLPEIELAATRSDLRMSGVYREGNGQAVIAADEAGEIDALLRQAVAFARQGIPYSEQAILLPALDPYDALLREAAAIHEVPLRFLEGAPLHQSYPGRKLLAALRWLDDPDELALFESALRAIGVNDRTSLVWKAIRTEYNAESNAPLFVRLTAVAKRLSQESAARCKTLANILQSGTGRKHCDGWRKLLETWSQESNDDKPDILKALLDLIAEAEQWFEEEPRMELREWHSLLLRKLLATPQPPTENLAGVWVGRMHALRGALFRVVLIPGGGVTTPGGESAVLPETLRAAWNQESLLHSFSVASDRDTEARWLFAMAVGQGEHCVVSAPKYAIATGTETSESAAFNDYLRSCYLSDSSGKYHATIPNRLVLAKQIALSERDSGISKRMHITGDAMPDDESEFAETLPSLAEWGDLQDAPISEEQLNRIRDSHSLADFFDCPLRGWFAHLLAIDVADRTDPTARLLGKVVHRVLEGWKNSLATADTANWDEAIANAIRDEGGRAIVNDPIEYALLARGAKSRLEVWRKLRNELPGEVSQVEMERWLGTKEQPVYLPLSHDVSMLFKGRVDAVETLANQTVRLLDFKTGNVESEKREIHSNTRILQGPLYASAAESADWGTIAEVVWMYLHPKVKRNAILQGDELKASREQALTIVETIRRNIRDGNFSPTPEPLPSSTHSVCTNCNFESVCGERIQAFPSSDTTSLHRDALAGMQYRKQCENAAGNGETDDE